MIDRHTGALTLSDARIHPDISEAEVRSLGFTPAGHGVWHRTTTDPRGRELLVGLRFVGRLTGGRLRYAVRRPAEDANGNLDWELARRDFHHAIVREWFASSVHDLMYAPPPQPGPLAFTFPWGAVRSVHHDGDAGSIIEIVYAGSAH